MITLSLRAERRLGLVALSVALMCLGVRPLSAQSDQKRNVRNLVQPTIPELAKRLNINGTVRVEVSIAPDGTVKRTRVLGGHPVLAVEAERAAQKTTFEPAPKETTQVIAFTF